jgi:hypothetical protein
MNMKKIFLEIVEVPSAHGLSPSEYSLIPSELGKKHPLKIVKDHSERGLSPSDHTLIPCEHENNIFL